MKILWNYKALYLVVQLKKIIDETAKLPGYTDDLKPKFISTDSTFKVVLMNVNYSEEMLENEKVSAIESKDSAIDEKVSAIERRIAEMKMDKRTKSNICKMFEVIGKDDVFGRTDVSDICGISYSTAGTLISKMKDYKLIEEITGYGKGKYKFSK